MIPSFGREVLDDDISSVDLLSANDIAPSLTWILLDDHFVGQSDGADAFAQSLETILNTERYEHDIFSDNYGSELNDLIGMPDDYCRAVIPQRIEDALMQDDRVQSVQDFKFESQKDKIFVRFSVTSKDDEQLIREVVLHV